MLEGLHVLPDINLNTILQYGRLVSHLIEDMLLPQPVDQSNIDEPPEILPPTIAKFLALALGLPAEHMQVSWDVLRNTCGPVLRFHCWMIMRHSHFIPQIQPV